MSTTELTQKQRFIRALAEYLAGTNQCKHSIGLSLGDPAAQEWGKIRRESGLFGYPTVEEAEEDLTRFLTS